MVRIVCLMRCNWLLILLATHLKLDALFVDYALARVFM